VWGSCSPSSKLSEILRSLRASRHRYCVSNCLTERGKMGFHAMYPGRCSKIADVCIIMRRPATVVTTSCSHSVLMLASAADLVSLNLYQLLLDQQQTHVLGINTTHILQLMRSRSTAYLTCASKRSLRRIRVCTLACPPYMLCHFSGLT
jgi:hypothetical protein